MNIRPDKTMNRTKLLVITLVFSVIIVMCAGGGDAVACNADLSQAANNCTISSALILNGTYSRNMNVSSSSDAVITISASNIVFDCNGTRIFGNGTLSGRGIYSSGKSNVTIKNCIIDSFYRGILLDNGDNLTLENVTASNAQQNVFLQNLRNSLVVNSNISNAPTLRTGLYLTASMANVTIANNTLWNNYQAIQLLHSTGVNQIYNNLIGYSNKTAIGVADIQFTNASNSKCFGNIIEQGTYYNIRFTSNSTNNSIYGNSLNGSTQLAIIVDGGSDNITINDNNISWVEHNGISLKSSRNWVYNNSVIYSAHHGIDIAYCLGGGKDSDSNLVEFNNISFTRGDTGVYVCGGNYNVLHSNSIIAFSNSSEDFSGITLAHGSKWNNVSENVLINISDAVVLYNFTSGNNVRGNVISLVQRYVYRLFFAQNETIRDEVFNFDVKALFSGTVNKTGAGFSLQNTNETTTSQLNIFNRSTSLIHNSTSLCNGSSSNIASNTGNINITLRPNEACWVLDNFNLTEGVTRENSPIWFSSSSSTSKHIASNISEPINVTISFNVDDCNNLETIKYTSDTGAYTATYTAAQLAGNCTNNVVTLDITGIEKAANSNVIDITYDIDRADLERYCTNLEDGFESLGELFSLIILAIILIVVIMMLGDSNYNSKDIFVAGVIGIIFVAIINIIGAIIVSYIC